MLHELQEQNSATFITYGPQVDGVSGIRIVDTFGEYEAEYAAIRKGVGILHLPQRGVVEVRGADRLDFLHRMITNDTKSLAAGQSRRAFLLGKTGRIEADIVVLQLADRTLIDMDRLDAPALVKGLSGYLFSEDVRFKDVSDDYVRLTLHGPAGVALLDLVTSPSLAGIAPWEHRTIKLPEHECVAYRWDDAGSIGLHLFVPAPAAKALYATLAHAVGGLCPSTLDGGAKRPIKGRGIGWLAYNTARIEAGTPLFHVDFGTDSLPHETALIPATVSFTKGCYLGQEIVARMQHLGHPKRILAGIRMPDQRMPVAGTAVYSIAPDAAQRVVIGGITSSTLSPMLGGDAIALAMMKWGKHTAGTQVLVPAEGGMVEAKVQGLAFL